MWKDASVSCQKDGGHLLSIHDIEEHSFVFSQLGYKPTDNLWIGLNDQKTTSYFECSDGTTVRFIKWQKGEPILISDVQEDCVIMSGENGYWADYFYEEELGYICKKKNLQNFFLEQMKLLIQNAKKAGKGPNPGCVAIRMGDAAGLWDVMNCEQRAPFLCKRLAEGVTPPPIPRATSPPPCPEE
ncbi:MRC1: Macrophage mannose receptor 1 [Crotalus adamanteus]|uniref:MRC1: Macrophage mannose receptor 1 n=1 Tax=Crotalus adamanteus TaxID=8729 RepID=A0AAW1B2S0_CROAD